MSASYHVKVNVSVALRSQAEPIELWIAPGFNWNRLAERSLAPLDAEGLADELVAASAVVRRLAMGLEDHEEEEARPADEDIPSVPPSDEEDPPYRRPMRNHF